MDNHLTLMPSNTGWCFLETPSCVSIQKGENIVEVSMDLAAVPDVEFVEIVHDNLTKEEQTMYEKYITLIKTKNSNKIIPTIPSDTLGISTTLPDFNDGQIPYSYQFSNIDWFGYTFFTTIYCKAGQILSLSSEGKDNLSHFIEVFSADEPNIYSWTKLSNDYGICEFSKEILKDGLYYIRLRSFKNGQKGFCSLSLNGSRKYTDVPVCSIGIDMNFVDNTDIYNIFTANSTGDPMITLMKGGTYDGTVYEYNDDYISEGDYDWRLNARIKSKLQKSQNISRVIISSGSSYNPTGCCELYLGCKNSSVIETDKFEMFIFLKEDDAIMSAPASSTYNCIAWSGGTASSWDWPSSASSKYATDGFRYDEGYTDLDAFDRYYADERYPGCTQYNRSIYTGLEDEGVDFWGVDYPDEKFVMRHASIKGNVDGHRHGYDWESKMSAGERIFHPRNAIRGLSAYSFGNILFHYTPINRQNGTYYLEESVADGKSIFANTELSFNQELFIKDVISNINNDLRIEFEQLYQKWQNICDNTYHSNPDIIRNCDEYRDLFNFCHKNGILKFEVYDKINRGMQSASILFDDLILINNEYYLQIMSSIRKDNWKNQFDAHGRKILYTNIFNQKMLLKHILPNENLLYSADKASDQNIEVSSNKFKLFQTGSHIDIQVYLKQYANVTIDIIDLQDGNIETVYNDIPNYSGNFSFTSKNELHGTYLVRLIQNGSILIKKIIL